MPTNSKSLSSALVPTGKRKEDLVEEKIDENILSLLGLTDVFDFTYEEYLSLLKEKMAAQRMQGGGDSGEAELITNEYKRVKGKTGKFKVKAKRVNVNKVVGKAEAQPVSKRSKVRLNPPKFLPRSEDTAPAPTPIPVVLPGGGNQQDNSGILNFLKNDLMSALQSINVLVSDILDNLKEQRVIDNKKAEQDRKLAEVDKKKKREEGLEKKESGKKTNALVDKIKEPFTGIFDAIKNFLMMVVKGSVIQFLLRVFKNPAILIKPIVNFVNSIIGFLNNIITWIYNLVITPINSAINFINSGLQGFIDQINKAVSIIPGVKDPIPSMPQIPTLDPMDSTNGPIPQVPMPQWVQGQQQLAEGGIVYGPGGTDNVNVKLTAGESVLQVGARERQIQATGIDPLAFNVGPNANKPSFKGGLPGFQNGGVVGGGRIEVEGTGNGVEGMLTMRNSAGKQVGPKYRAISGTYSGIGISQEKRRDVSGAGYPMPDGTYKVHGMDKHGPLGGKLSGVGNWSAFIGPGAGVIGNRSGIMIHNDINSDGTKGCIGVEFGGKANTKSEKQFLNTWAQINPKEISVNLAGGAANSTEVSQGIPSPTPDNTTQKSSNPLQGALQTGLSIAKKGLSMIPGMPSGAGDISYLPLPLNQGLKASTGSSGPNSTPPVVFSAHDSFSVATHVASAIYGIGS